MLMLLRYRLAYLVMLLATSLVVQAATNPTTDVSIEKLMRTPAAPVATDPSLDRVNTRGGFLVLTWNDGLLADLGMARAGFVAGQTNPMPQAHRFSLDKKSSFEVDAAGVNMRTLAGGEARFQGRVQFRLAGKPIDWRNPKLLVRPGAEPRIDFVSNNGEVLFYADRIMYELTDNGQTLSFLTADVRISKVLAELLGNPTAADLAVADLKLQSPVESRIKATLSKATGAPYWPGQSVTDQPGAPPGAVWQADVFMHTFSAQYTRCGLCDANHLNCALGGCDGPSGAANGLVVFTPSSTLTNNRNRGSALPTVNDPLGTSTALYGADVPWYQKFTTSPNHPNFAYPYLLNDQHPYLIWNLYRLDADGSITQIGRSGLKHAFATTNSNPGNPADICEGSNGTHVLGRACQDTYSSASNDSSFDLGPRSEVIPALGIWGRCGSIFDPDCNNVQNNNGNTLFSQRMLVREADLPASTPEVPVSYLFESWYLVRDDINIYNTMATRGVTPNWNSVMWNLSNVGDPYLLGPAIDRWVAPDAPTAWQMNQELAAPEGHAKVAVKVTDLLDGTWRYDYAVMNLDFSRAITVGIESNHTLQVIRNNGFQSFSIKRDPTADISSLTYVDGDPVRPDWTVTVNTDSVTWSAPDDAPPGDPLNLAASLNWGTMVRFSLIANRAPFPCQATLGVTEPGTPSVYSVASLVVGDPEADRIFRNGFDEEIDVCGGP